MGYFTAPELARITGYHRTHIVKLINTGVIEGKKFGKMWMIPDKELDYLTKRKKIAEKNPGRKVELLF